MGGISKSSLILNDLGNGQFMGHVSLANNGGFASIHWRKAPQYFSNGSANTMENTLQKMTGSLITVVQNCTNR